ncbi:hypothetical protein JCM11251_000140 [Rhodosporidiobolus azoricus]
MLGGLWGRLFGSSTAQQDLSRTRPIAPLPSRARQNASPRPSPANSRPSSPHGQPVRVSQPQQTTSPGPSTRCTYPLNSPSFDTSAPSSSPRDHNQPQSTRFSMDKLDTHTLMQQPYAYDFPPQHAPHTYSRQYEHDFATDQLPTPYPLHSLEPPNRSSYNPYHALDQQPYVHPYSDLPWPPATTQYSAAYGQTYPPSLGQHDPSMYSQYNPPYMPRPLDGWREEGGFGEVDAPPTVKRQKLAEVDVFSDHPRAVERLAGSTPSPSVHPAAVSPSLPPVTLASPRPLAASHTSAPWASADSSSVTTSNLNAILTSRQFAEYKQYAALQRPLELAAEHAQNSTFAMKRADLGAGLVLAEKLTNTEGERPYVTWIDELKKYKGNSAWTELLNYTRKVISVTCYLRLPYTQQRKESISVTCSLLEMYAPELRLSHDHEKARALAMYMLRCWHQAPNPAGFDLDMFPWVSTVDASSSPAAMLPAGSTAPPSSSAPDSGGSAVAFLPQAQGERGRYPTIPKVGEVAGNAPQQDTGSEPGGSAQMNAPNTRSSKKPDNTRVVVSHDRKTEVLLSDVRRFLASRKIALGYRRNSKTVMEHIESYGYSLSDVANCLRDNNGDELEAVNPEDDPYRTFPFSGTDK